MCKTRLLAIIIAAFPVLAPAHHSTIEYSDDLTEFEGVVESARWGNPHVQFSVRTVEEDGEERLWVLEGSAFNALTRRGLEPDRNLVGNQVTVQGRASTRRANHMFVVSIRTADGNELRLSSGGRLTSAERSREAAETPDASGTLHGIFRVWAIAGGRRVPLDGELPLTESASRAKAGFDPHRDDPLLRCVPPGMPPTMGNPYPMKFVEGDGEIFLHLEEFDLVRTIHLDADAAAGPAASTPLGHSTGRWENERSLLVETGHINYPFFNRVGVPQTEQVSTRERFTLSADESRLDYELEITDPGTLTEPVTWSTYYAWRPGEEVKPYNCTVGD